MEGCVACDLTAGRRPLPGGRIHSTEHWAVEHCIGPLGLGTLIVKPIRHVSSLAALTEAEAHGPALQVGMFAHGSPPDPTAVQEVSSRARLLFTSPSGAST